MNEELDYDGFFVYGTLRPDLPKKNLTSWGEKWNGFYGSNFECLKSSVYGTLYIGEYPFASFEGGNSEIQGFLCKFKKDVTKKEKAEMIKYLDLVEGFPEVYKRKKVSVYLSSEKNNNSDIKVFENVFIYYMDEEQKKKCFKNEKVYLEKTGDYLNYLKKN